MWCDVCKRLLAADEPVWHVQTGHTHGEDIYGNVINPLGTYSTGNVCRQCCEHKGTNRDFINGEFRTRPWLHDREMKWQPPQPCDQCGRPVHWSGRRRFPMHFVCSWGCQRRAWWGKSRYVPRPAPKGRACADCGKRFYPKRTDARFCSAACRQRAYREREQRR